MPKRNFTLVGAHAGKTITLDKHHFMDGVLAFEGPDADVLILTRVLRDQYQAYGPDELEEAKAAYEEAQAEAALADPKETSASLEMDLKQKFEARRMIIEGLDPETLYGPGPMADKVKANMAILRAEDEDVELMAMAEQIEAQRLAKEATYKEGADKVAADEKARLDKDAADAATAKAAETAGSGRPPTENEQGVADPNQVPQENGGGEQVLAAAKIETVADALQVLDPANEGQWTARGVPSIEAMTKLLGRDVSRAEIEAVAPDYTRSVAKAAKASAK